MNALKRLRSLGGAVQGNYWTLWPQVQRSIRAPQAPPATPFEHTFADERVGSITLSGELHSRGDEEALVIVVHGLGGSIESGYTKNAAMSAVALGAACLRINLRGANRQGDDIYHAGLRKDLDEVLRAKAVAPFKRIHVLGYSLGGHVTLHYAAEPRDPRVRSFAAICPPLFLAPGVAHIDRRRSSPYRRHVLKGLKEIFASYAARGRPLPCDPADAAAAETLREWDTRVVAPHFGFSSAEHYWESQSVGSVLHAISAPTLIVTAKHDPMVPFRSAADLLLGGSLQGTPIQSVITGRGGHVGFPAGLDLGLALGGESVEGQVVRWLLAA